MYSDGDMRLNCFWISAQYSSGDFFSSSSSTANMLETSSPVLGVTPFYGVSTYRLMALSNLKSLYDMKSRSFSFE